LRKAKKMINFTTLKAGWSRIDRIAPNEHVDATRGAPVTGEHLTRLAQGIDSINAHIVCGEESVLRVANHAAAPSPAATAWADECPAHALLDAYDCVYIKADRAGNVAGYAAIEATEAGVYLGYIATHPHLRQEGIARELMGAVLGDHARVTLHVGERNTKAQAFYRSIAQAGHHVEEHLEDWTYPDGEGAIAMAVTALSATKEEAHSPRGVGVEAPHELRTEVEGVGAEQI
jgi:ribosomal protein S18 acetylase RimI-like enzyme